MDDVNGLTFSCLFDANGAVSQIVGSCTWLGAQVEVHLVPTIVGNETVRKVTVPVPSVVKVFMQRFSSFSALPLSLDLLSTRAKLPA